MISGSTSRCICGWDRWHAYELSWLDARGCPLSRVGRFDIPADSPCMVESKSFKLYLNSLNNTSFESERALRETLVKDLGAVLGAAPQIELFPVDDAALGATALQGLCLDGLPVPAPGAAPDAALLQCGEGETQQAMYTHLLRSLCPVTGQPDWATLWLEYRGPRIEQTSLLSYLLAFRSHRDFHEQCVERIFRDVLQTCEPGYLRVQAFYTRRGGLDINPMRATDPASKPLPRLNRQ